MGRGSLRPMIHLIGEAPGAAEAETGKPFMGQSGQHLQRIIDALGLTNRIYISNVARCRPHKNRKPTYGEAKECATTYLLPEMRLLRPPVFVTLGTTARDVMFRWSKPHNGELVPHDMTIAGCPGIPTWHPAYYLYTGNKQVLRDIRAAILLAKSVALRIGA